jgi:hypothetical protein
MVQNMRSIVDDPNVPAPSWPDISDAARNVDPEPESSLESAKYCLPDSSADPPVSEASDQARIEGNHARVERVTANEGGRM